MKIRMLRNVSMRHPLIVSKECELDQLVENRELELRDDTAIGLIEQKLAEQVGKQSSRNVPTSRKIEAEDKSPSITKPETTVKK